MEPEMLEKYKQAGKICAEIRAEVLKMIKPGVKLLELADFIEGQIATKGAGTAFPVNISLNDHAAHDTPDWNDVRVIEAGDLVKIDIGTHVDGYIGDMAFTWCSEKHPLIEANQKILQAAIDICKPGVTVGDIGTAIEDKTKELGIGIITNLTGHCLKQYDFHAQPSIPNVRNENDHAFEDGDVVAIEPFAVERNGIVKESGTKVIYQHMMDRPVRLTESRRILAMARDDWHGFPFAKRWLYKKISPVKVNLALRQLEQVMAIQPYPVLKESTGQKVSQAEHTIVIGEKPLVTTKLE
jgi:methionyl aminopeptidase